MTELRLGRPPIVEAVLDLDCDMPPGWDLGAIEAKARDAFRGRYPTLRTQLFHEQRIEAPGGAELKLSMRRGLQALQFLQEDERQLVQVRASGFSFNRLAPYTVLDDYLEEIRRTWDVFREVGSPVQLRSVRLRYINRILLPKKEGPMDLEEYLLTGPRLPEEDALRFVGFVDRHSMVEGSTGHRVDVILATQPEEHGQLPILLDIQTTAALMTDPEDWASIDARIGALRGLKNRVFQRTLTEECLRLFQ